MMSLRKCKWCDSTMLNDSYGESCEDCWANRQSPNLGGRLTPANQFRSKGGGGLGGRVPVIHSPLTYGKVEIH